MARRPRRLTPQAAPGANGIAIVSTNVADWKGGEFTGDSPYHVSVSRLPVDRLDS
jgi:hypothetical protein